MPALVQIHLDLKNNGGLPVQVFCSIHLDDVDAVTVLHPCTVFFLLAASLARNGPPKVRWWCKVQV